MRPRSSFVARIAITLACLATPAIAQSTTPMSSTKGVLLGAHLNGSAIKFTDSNADPENGGGLALQLGYGFTPQFALLFDVTGANIGSTSGDYALAHVDLLGRFAWTAKDRSFVPYLEAGFTGIGASQKMRNTSGSTSTVTISGTGGTFGGGLQYYTTPSFALGASLKWTTGTFTTVKVDNTTQGGYNEKVTTARFNLGVTWYPSTAQ